VAPTFLKTYRTIDIQKAIELIREFTQDQTFETYQKNAMANSAVERQLSIVGEAIVQC
jgi:uncharacterized protein with HEPN domain